MRYGSTAMINELGVQEIQQVLFCYVRLVTYTYRRDLLKQQEEDVDRRFGFVRNLLAHNNASSHGQHENHRDTVYNKGSITGNCTGMPLQVFVFGR